MSAGEVDRAAAVRRALRTLVAQHGLHGASMSAVARAAGVATGTSYTHFASKRELLLACYVETKRELSTAATGTLDGSTEPEDRFIAMWISSYRHLAEHREDAAFLLQIDASPYRADAHDAALSSGPDPVVEQVQQPDLARRLLQLPLEVLYELGLAPAVRLAEAAITLTDSELNQIARACWRAVSQPQN